MPHVIALKGVIFSIMLIFNIAGLRRSGQELEFLIAFALWSIDFYKIFKDNEFSDDPE